MARIGLGLLVIAASTALLVAAGADLAFASVALLFLVVGASIFGYGPGLVTAVASAALLTYYFTPPLHSFAIDPPDDILAMAAFVAVSLGVSATVARLNQLRRRSELGAREARVRLDLTDALGAGLPPSTVVDTLARDLVDLFDLASSRVTAGDDVADARGVRPAVGSFTVSGTLVTFELQLGRALEPGESATIEALASGLAIALDRARLDTAARDQQLRADLARSRAGFLTAVTHDLRTPLATIKTATGALLAPDSPLDAEERHELLEATYSEAARLEGLVTKVLELTRIRTGAILPEPFEIEAPDLVRAAVDRLGPAGRQRGIALELDPDLPALEVDSLLMEYALVNLLENALLHDPSGCEILVRGSAVGGRVELAVVDHGPGIPVADRERVFEEFVRLRAATDGPGTGLGLAIVRSLVNANRGIVRYEDTPGGGATFVVNLPVAGDICSEVTTP